MMKAGSMMISYQPLGELPNFFRSIISNQAQTEEDIDFISNFTPAPVTTSSSSTFSFFFLSAFITRITCLAKKNFIEEIDVLHQIPGPMPHLVTKVELYVLGGEKQFFVIILIF